MDALSIVKGVGGAVGGILAATVFFVNATYPKGVKNFQAWVELVLEKPTWKARVVIGLISLFGMVFAFAVVIGQIESIQKPPPNAALESRVQRFADYIGSLAKNPPAQALDIRIRYLEMEPYLRDQNATLKPFETLLDGYNRLPLQNGRMLLAMSNALSSVKKELEKQR